MATLDFHGPFHFDDIDKNGQIKPTRNPNKSPNPDKPGIYIWGFMYYYDANGLTVPVDFNKTDISFNENKMKFIPYYVGKSEGNTYKERIIHHHDVRNIMKSKSVHADKYIRFSHAFMTKFFYGNSNFPIKVGNHARLKSHIALINSFPNSITYHNNRKILQLIYPQLKIIYTVSGKKKIKFDHPITMQKINGNYIPDTLADIVINMNNFWFCYARSEEKKVALTELETCVFYSLKGKTISKTDKCPIKSNGISINNCTSSDIFKKSPSEIFKGY
mgnify:CR=1 FL=1